MQKHLKKYYLIPSIYCALFDSPLILVYRRLTQTELFSYLCL